MNKYVFLGLGLIVLIIIGIIIKIKTDNSKKELVLNYKISAGIPFKWVYEIENPEVVEFVKSYVTRDDNKGGKVGAKVYTNYVFRGLKEGETTITFKIVSITGEHEDNTHDINRVRVDKDLNVLLIGDENRNE